MHARWLAQVANPHLAGLMSGARFGWMQRGHRSPGQWMRAAQTALIYWPWAAECHWGHSAPGRASGVGCQAPCWRAVPWRLGWRRLHGWWPPRRPWSGPSGVSCCGRWLLACPATPQLRCAAVHSGHRRPCTPAGASLRRHRAQHECPLLCMST